jgi:hypothetical protein
MVFQLSAIMGKCPNCGVSYLLSNPSDKCDWCGKVTCEKCSPSWFGSFAVKDKMETEQKDAGYVLLGFCSEPCSDSFWQAVLNYSLAEVGTDINRFGKNLRKIFYSAILNAFNSNPSLRAEAIESVKWAIDNETETYRAIQMGLDDGTLEPDKKDLINDFVKRGYSTLALNLEKCGRPLDAAEIYEKHLKLYDKARLLREKDKQVIVRRTDVSVNLNELLRQIKEGGIVAVYRCPHCNGPLKINNKSSIESLKICEHCGSKIETVDLADFLKTALS